MTVNGNEVITDEVSEQRKALYLKAIKGIELEFNNTMQQIDEHPNHQTQKRDTFKWPALQ